MFKQVITVHCFKSTTGRFGLSGYRKAKPYSIVRCEDSKGVFYEMPCGTKISYIVLDKYFTVDTESIVKDALGRKYEKTLPLVFAKEVKDLRISYKDVISKAERKEYYIAKHKVVAMRHVKGIGKLTEYFLWK